MAFKQIVYSRVGVIEKNAEYQISGISDGIDDSLRNTFLNFASGKASALDKLSANDRLSNYESLCILGGTLFFVNTTSTLAEDGRTACIVSGVFSDGDNWRKYLQSPEYLFNSKRNVFYTSSPSGALPGRPALLPTLEMLPQNDKPLNDSLIREKYGISDEKLSSILRCLYFCMCSNNPERMLIVLPEEQISNDTAREIMYVISKKLPSSLRAQLSYRVHNFPLDSIITFSSTRVVKAFKYLVNLSDDNSVNDILPELIRGLSFCGKMGPYLNDDTITQKMDEFIQEGNLFLNAGKSVVFNPDVNKFGKNYLLAGSYMYASDECEKYYNSGDIASGFNLAALCNMVGPKKAETEQKPAWDKVVASLLKQFNEHPVYSDGTDGEMRLDEEAVMRSVEKGWHNISFEGSCLSKEFINYVIQNPSRMALYESKCLNGPVMGNYTELLTEICKKNADSVFDSWPANKWYKLRERYLERNKLNNELSTVLIQRFRNLAKGKRAEVINAANYEDRSLAEEFLNHEADTFNTLDDESVVNKHFVPLSNIYPDLIYVIENSSRFALIKDTEKSAYFRNKLSKSIGNSDAVLDILNSDSLLAMKGSCIASSMDVLPDELEMFFAVIEKSKAIEKLPSDFIFSKVRPIICTNGEDICSRMLKEKTMYSLSPAQLSEIFTDIIATYGENNPEFIVNELLESKLISRIDSKNIGAVYSKAIDYIAGKNDDYIVNQIFSKNEFNQLSKDYKFELISKVALETNKKNVKKILSLPAFTENKGNQNSLINSLIAKYLVNDRSFVAESLMPYAKNKEDLIRTLISECGTPEEFSKLIPSFNLNALSQNEKFMIIDAAASKIKDYTDYFSDEDLLSRYSESDKLKNAITSIDDIHSPLFLKYVLKNLKKSKDYSFFDTLSKKTQKALLEKEFESNGKTYGEFTSLADHYYSGIGFDADHLDIPSVDKMIDTAETLKLPNYRSKLSNALSSMIDKELSKADNKEKTVEKLEKLPHAKKYAIESYWNNISITDYKLSNRSFYSSHAPSKNKGVYSLFDALSDAISDKKNCNLSILENLAKKGDIILPDGSKVNLKKNDSNFINAQILPCLNGLTYNQLVKYPNLLKLSGVKKPKSKSKKKGGLIAFGIALAACAAILMLLVRPALKLFDSIRGEWVDESNPTVTAFEITKLCKYESGSEAHRWLPGFKQTITLDGIGKCTLKNGSVKELECEESGKTYLYQRDVSKMFKIVELDKDNAYDHISVSFETDLTDANSHLLKLEDITDKGLLTYIGCSEDFSITLEKINEQDSTSVVETYEKPFFELLIREEAPKTEIVEEVLPEEDGILENDSVEAPDAEANESENIEDNITEIEESTFSYKIVDVNGTLYYVFNSFVDTAKSSSARTIVLNNGTVMSIDGIK